MKRRRLAAAAGLAFVACSATAAATAPLTASMVTVTALAGPHLWCESRVLLTLVPPRLGALRRPLLRGLLGAAGLALAILVIVALGLVVPPVRAHLPMLTSGWLTVLWLWVASLVASRGTERGRDRGWAWPVALGACALAWLAPHASMLTLVFAHPLVALALLWRLVRRRCPRWLPAFALGIAAAAASVAVLVVALGRAPGLDASDPVASRIVAHAGSFVLPGVSSHLLVALHVHLEVLHYAAWIVLLPLVVLRARPWSLGDVPLARRGPAARRAVAAALAFSAMVALGLIACFILDEATTRDVYFTLAIVHVLAEVPVLVRLT